MWILVFGPPRPRPRADGQARQAPFFPAAEDAQVARIAVKSIIQVADRSSLAHSTSGACAWASDRMSLVSHDPKPLIHRCVSLAEQGYL